MGFLSSLLGTNNDYQAQQANLQNPVTNGQYNQAAQQFGQAYNQTGGGLDQQQAFVSALNAQGGLQNQSSVFGQQQALADQLGQQAQGQGPNPALAQLNQTTGNNIASQAALMAGQRGAGANAGLLARQAAMQGGALQQQAVGQGATMQAQQQIAAQQTLANQQAQMAGLANTQVGQQASGLQGLNTGLQNRAQLAQGQQNAVLGGIGAQNNANVSMQSNINNANAGVSEGNQKMAGTMAGGAFSGLSGAAGLLLNQGGVVPKKSFVTQHLCMGGASYKEGGSVPGKAPVMGDSPKNDTVAAKLSPGEIVIPRHILQSKDPAAAAAEFVKQTLAKKGKK